MNRPRRERPRLLLVEDHKIIRESLAKLFAHAGYDVVACRDASEGVEAMATKYGMYDAAIVDLMLPDESGDVLIGNLKRVRGAARVIACTACSPGSSFVSAAIAAGADAVHFKPFDFPSLLAHVRGLST